MRIGPLRVSVTTRPSRLSVREVQACRALWTYRRTAHPTMKVTTNTANGPTNSIGFLVRILLIVCIIRFYSWGRPSFLMACQPTPEIRLHAGVRRRVTLMCGEVYPYCA